MMIQRIKLSILLIVTPLIFLTAANAGENPSTADKIVSYEQTGNIFDDKVLLNGYAARFQNFPKEILLEMIKDETLTPIKTASAVKVFKEKYSREIAFREKKSIEKILLRLLNREDSPFVQVEAIHTLCILDRYRYFKPMGPLLIQKLDHYNSLINQMAFDYLNDLIKPSITRPREARIVFNTLRKVLFLSRNRLAQVREPDEKLSLKLKLLRSSIKILGNQELKRLPKEVINLL